MFHCAIIHLRCGNTCMTTCRALDLSVEYIKQFNTMKAWQQLISRGTVVKVKSTQLDIHRSEALQMYFWSNEWCHMSTPPENKLYKLTPKVLCTIVELVHPYSMYKHNRHQALVVSCQTMEFWCFPLSDSLHENNFVSKRAPSSFKIAKARRRERCYNKLRDACRDLYLYMVKLGHWQEMRVAHSMTWMLIAWISVSLVRFWQPNSKNSKCHGQVRACVPDVYATTAGIVLWPHPTPHKCHCFSEPCNAKG
jgi:hypothetical protein